MKSKAARIILDTVASVIVLVVMMVLGSTIAGKILGYTTDANGVEKINGGGATTITLFAIGVAVTVIFAIYFYKLLRGKSNTVINNVDE